MIIVDRTDEDDNGDSGKNGDTLNPVNLGLGTSIDRVLGTGFAVFASTERLIETESE